MKDIFRLFVVIGWFSAVLLAPISVKANESPLIYISEVAWAGSSLSNADEWIELVNLGTDVVDISGWILTGAGSGGSTITLPGETLIEPSSTYLISNYDSEHEKSVLAVESNFVTTSVSLSNSALGITLTNELGTIVDSAGDGSAPQAGSSGEYKTMTRINTDDGTLETSWAEATDSSGFDPGATELGTPGSTDLSFNEETYDPDSTDPEDEDEEPEDGNETSGTDSTDSTESETNETLPAHYPTGTLIINEFLSDPVSGEEEWIEIWNPYNNVVDLVGWTVQDGSGTKTDLPDQLLGMHQFVLVTAPKGKLNNDGDTIILLDPTNGVVDKITYGTGSIPAVSDPNSVARDDDNTWHQTETPTPGWANEIALTVEPKSETEIELNPTPTEPVNSSTAPEPTEEIESETSKSIIVTSYDLRLVSVYPNTDEGDATSESISIQNIGLDIIELSGWKLADASKDYGLPNVSIEPDETLTFYRTETNLALNNSGGETVSIIAPNGVITDQLTYDKTKKGYQLILSSSGWTWQSHALGDESEDVETNEIPTELPTEPINMALAPNPLEEIETSDKKSEERIFESELKSVRAMARGTEVKVTGTVSVEPGVLSKQTMYLAGSGIQIYFYRANWPELTRGDTVTLTGELVESYNETRIKISSLDDIAVIGHTNEPVPHEISLESIDEETEGWLVSVSGTIQTIENDRLTLEKNGMTLKVVAKEGTGIDLGEFLPGDEIKITGLVSQYYEEYRLLPRDQNDFVNIELAPSGLAGLSSKEQAVGRRGMYAVALATLTGIALLVLAIKFRLKQQPIQSETRKLNYNVIN